MALLHLQFGPVQFQVLKRTVLGCGPMLSLTSICDYMAPRKKKSHTVHDYSQHIVPKG